MVKIANYIRIDEWIDSKVTMLVGVWAYFACIYETNIADNIWSVVAFFLYVSMFLAISYVVNDFFDIDIDRRAGKNKVIATLPKAIIWLSLVVMIIIGIVPILLVTSNKLVTFVIIFATYLMGLAYSIPGLRFKEKGVWGLIECSFAQRCMPLAILPLICQVNIYYYVVWIAISFLSGMRYILIHQILDRVNDINTGVNTYATSGAGDLRKIIVFCFAAEVVLSIVVLIPVISYGIIAVIAGVVVCVLLECCIYRVLCVYAQKDWLTIFDSVPLEAYYNIISPIVMAIILVQSSMWALMLVLLIVICCIRAIIVKCRFVHIFAKSFIK